MAINYAVRAIVRGAYDQQKLRIQTGLRLVANFKVKLGIQPGEKEETALDLKGKEILKDLRVSFKRLTDGVADSKIEFAPTGSELISDFSELALVRQYLNIEKAEVVAFKDLERIIHAEPLWNEFLAGVRGCGPAMAGVILSEFDIHKAKYCQSLVKYAGIDVAGDGRGRGRYQDHLIDVEYTAKDGTTKTKKSITYNPFLKTKLLGVMVPNFIKLGNNKYERAYRNYKNRLENMPAHADKTKLHRNNMAKRYALKIFLIDLYKAWRPLEGLIVHPPYHEAKLGRFHGEDRQVG